MNNLVDKSIKKLKLMFSIDWDGDYPNVLELIKELNQSTILCETIMNFEKNENFTESKIIIYLEENYDNFFKYGIKLFELQNFFNINSFIEKGNFLHNSFLGYKDSHFLSFHIDCLDYLHSSAHFYNEAYDLFYDKRAIILDSEVDPKFPYDLKRIQPKEEVMLRNFRESFINLIFFIESFINSVGYDAFLNNYGENENDKLKLRGIERISNSGFETYSSLKKKIQNIAYILNNIVIDTEVEPYKSYLQNNVELRNQYVHSTPKNSKIFFDHYEWKEKCDSLISKDCMDFLLEFWKSCYPNKSFPKNIFNTFSGNSFKGHQGKFMN